MKNTVTIIPSDNLIIVEGEGLTFGYEKPEGIHAIQWKDGKGFVEFTDKRHNKIAEYEQDVLPYVQAFEVEKKRLEDEMSSIPLPTLHEQACAMQLTKREFLKLVIGLTADFPTPITLTMIEDYVAQADDNIRLEWTYANHIERNHPMLDVVSASFGISAEMLDIMFVNKDDLLHKLDNNLPLS